MTYINELIVRGVLSGNDVGSEISLTLLRLKNTYGPHCVSITPLEVQVFLDGVYRRGPVLNNVFFSIETVNLQIGKSDNEPNFWVAKIAIVVNDQALHDKLKTVQHGDDTVFTAQS